MLDKYEPTKIEPPLLRLWEAENLFNPDYSSATKTYSIVIPPPNVTGSLHIGHALVNTLQDILIRFQRLQGKKTLWLPGTDHAGIATQMMVEKDLLQKKINIKELKRDEFLEHVWDWKNRHGSRIKNQLKRIGCSLDWSRERFTLDARLSKAVNRAFVEFFKRGWIYKGERLVNWCPADKTALSDLEVDHIETAGKLYEIAYRLVAGGSIKIATTRPETLLGDVAIAVNPEDDRYRDLIGQEVVVPLVERKVPIIADETCDPEFGTGALKITPAHDFNDFEIGQRHKLPNINIFTESAEINEIYPKLQGVDRFLAREKIVAMLQETKQLKAIKDHNHMVAYSQRKKSVIEPRLSEQWFFDVKPLAKRALSEVACGNLKVYPTAQKNTLQRWLEGIQSWCISRQLWWGHPIPAFFCDRCRRYYAFLDSEAKVCPECQNSKLIQETDVLDTWFSSGLFPFSTMGWPDDTADMRLFYPNSTLITAYDILFFWVARMVMMGLGLTDKLPFFEVYAHGLVRDAKGRKMSKTTGNVIDPLDIIEKHGADALRLTLCMNTSLGHDIKLAERDILTSKLFLNKLFNAAKFVAHHNKARASTEHFQQNSCDSVLERWILKKLCHLVQNANDNIAKYRFHELGQVCYQFMWRDFCDTYLEIAKTRLISDQNSKGAQEAAKLAHLILNLVLLQLLRVLHPIIPFLSEDLFQKIYPNSGFLAVAEYSLIQQKWTDFKVDLAEEFLAVLDAVRSIRGENNLHPRKLAVLRVQNASLELKKLLQAEFLVVQALAKVSRIDFVAATKPQPGWADFSCHKLNLQLDLQGSLGKDALENSSEQARLKKLLLKLQDRREFLEKKLNNPNFVAKAPAKLVDETRLELKQVAFELAKLEKK